MEVKTMYARDYRAIARENLSGRWGIAVLVSFLAVLLGGPITGASSSIRGFNF
jgi:uncharacterized membrane protein